MILRLTNPRPRLLFYVTMAGLALALVLTSLPTLMLVTGIVWPSVYIILQLATIGAGLLAVVLFVTATLLIWSVVAAIINRL